MLSAFLRAVCTQITPNRDLGGDGAAPGPPPRHLPVPPGVTAHPRDRSGERGHELGTGFGWLWGGSVRPSVPLSLCPSVCPSVRVPACACPRRRRPRERALPAAARPRRAAGAWRRRRGQVRRHRAGVGAGVGGSSRVKGSLEGFPGAAARCSLSGGGFYQARCPLGPPQGESGRPEIPLHHGTLRSRVPAS